jgi:hypothetical protein
MISDRLSDKLAYIQGEQGSFRSEKAFGCFSFKLVKMLQTAL